MFIVMLILVTNRMWVAFGTSLTLCGAVAALDGAKRSVLQQPIYPSDVNFLTDPGLLLGFVEPWVMGLGVVALVGSVPTVILLGRLWGRGNGPVLRLNLLARVVAGTVLAAFICSAAWFHSPGNPWRYMFTTVDGVEFVPWAQATNYRIHGFVGGYFYNTTIDPMEAPLGYSESAMGDLAARYDGASPPSTGSVLDDANVVVVLSEGFADLSRLTGFELAADSMPLTRKIMDQTWSGSTIANFFGNGTASMEFEVLTGQSLGLFEPQIISPYQDFMSTMSSYPSAVGYFKAQGYKAVAIHPYKHFMYKRDEVYPMLGFDQFLDDTTMREQTVLEDTNYISDTSAFDETVKTLRDEDQPVLVNLVTMQNHGPTEGWDDPVEISGDIDQASKEGIGGFAAGQKVTDEALDNFLRQLKSSDEETYVIFYGDHYPPSFSTSLATNQPGRTIFQTPFFLWSSAHNESKPLPVTGPASFMPKLLEMAGAPLPPYYRLLSSAAKHLGAVGPGYITGADGADLDQTTLTPYQQQLLDDLRMVQYDFSVGSRYAVDRMWYEFD